MRYPARLVSSLYLYLGMSLFLSIYLYRIYTVRVYVLVCDRQRYALQSGCLYMHNSAFGGIHA